jgi:hypothetical protein
MSSIEKRLAQATTIRSSPNLCGFLLPSARCGSCTLEPPWSRRLGIGDGRRSWRRPARSITGAARRIEPRQQLGHDRTLRNGGWQRQPRSWCSWARIGLGCGMGLGGQPLASDGDPLARSGSAGRGIGGLVLFLPCCLSFLFTHGCGIRFR